MGTVKLMQDAFNAGEWSPLLEGRTALAKYRNAVKKLQNMVPYPHGAAARRPGFRFVQQCKETYDPNDNRELELKFNNNVTDSSPNGVTVTNTNVTFDAGTKKTGTHSASFNGTTAFLSIADSEYFNLYQRDFFIQFWILPNACAAEQVIFSQRTDANNYMQIRIKPGFDSLGTNPWYIELAICVGGSETVVLTSTYNPQNLVGTGDYGMTEGQWYHIGIGRRKDVYYLFIDGTQNEDSYTFEYTSYAKENRMDVANYTGTIYIGQDGAGAKRFKGWLDYFCIAKVCEHEEVFTPPTTESETYTCTKWRLLPFEFSTEQAYIIELGHRYARFYRNKGAILDGGSPYEIALPYHENDIDDIQITQSIDVLYLVHPGYPPVEVSRTGHTAWTWAYMKFDPPPVKEQGHAPSAAGQTLTPSATDGQGITLTAGSAIFLSGDVGRIVEGDGGRAVITAFSSSTSVTADVIIPFPSVAAIAANDWSILGSPNDKLLPSKLYPKGAMCTLTTDSLDCFRSEDVGKYILMYGGAVQITKFTSATSVRGRIIKILKLGRDPYDPEAPIKATKNWSLESAAWNNVNGYPSCIAFFEDRLFQGGTPEYPETVWGSDVGNYYSHKVGIEDDKSVEFTLGGRQCNALKWIEPRESLMLGTVNGEWKLGPSDSGIPLTPLNVVARQVSNNGCAGKQPVVVRNSTLFIQRAAKKLRELTYKWEEDAWNAPDLTILAEHLTRAGMVDVAYQQEPLSIVWVVMGDGLLLGLTYMREEDVIGWHRHPTAGEVQNVAVIPGSGNDELWAIIKRNIAGTDKYFVEILSDYFSDDRQTFEGNNGVNAFFVDCGLTYEGAAATTITGLDHLNGMEVAILADGKVKPRQTVANGQIELDEPASVVHAGLPYASILTTMRPAYQKQDGTSQGRYGRVQKAKIRVKDTAPFKVGRDETEGGLSVVTMPTNDRLCNGDINCPALDTPYDQESRLTILQEDPAPLTLIAIMADVENED